MKAVDNGIINQINRAGNLMKTYAEIAEKIFVVDAFIGKFNFFERRRHKIYGETEMYLQNRLDTA